MEYDKIKQLMEDMGKSNIEELEIEFPEGMKISMKKNVAVVPAQQVVAQQSTNIPVVQSIQTTQPIQEEPKEEYKEIKSPMVGTFYSKPSPDKEEFVKVGDTITVRKPAKFVAKNFIGEVEEQDISEGSVDVKMDRYRDVTVNVSSKEMTLDIKDFSKQVIEPALTAIAEAVDIDLLTVGIEKAGSKVSVSANPTISDIANVAKALESSKR